jgi:hypothetical protein
MNGAIEYWQRLDYLAKVNLLHVGVWLAYWLVFDYSWYYATLYTILSFFVIRVSWICSLMSRLQLNPFES